MKTKLIITILLLFATIVLIAQDDIEDSIRARCHYYTAHPEMDPCSDIEEGEWRLVLDEEFDDGFLDLSNWFTCADGWLRHRKCELQYYLDENIRINNGVLSLIAKDTTVCKNVIENGTNVFRCFPYSSGRIDTKHKFKYGLFEIRCKIPKGIGLWPAFWLFGGNEEIDIFEFGCKNTKRHHMSLHNWHCDEDDSNHCFCTKARNYGIDFSKEFHTFSAKWNEFKVVFFVDGDIKRIYYNYYTRLFWSGVEDCEGFSIENNYHITKEFPYYPERLKVNLAIADGPSSNCSLGDFEGPPDNTVIFPKTMDVDYIRVWRRSNSHRNVTIYGSYDFDHLSSAITGGNITLGGSSEEELSIDSEHALSLVASNSITLLPGFCVEKNAGFMARCNSGEERCLPLINDSIANYNDSIFDYNDSSDIRHHSYSYNQNEAIQDTDRLLLEEDYQNLYDSFEKENGCQLFPNPAKNGFFIKVKNNAFCRVDVFEINGYPIKHFDGQKELLFFDMSGVAQGVYIVRIIIKDTVFYHKIIVE